MRHRANVLLVDTPDLPAPPAARPSQLAGPSTLGDAGPIPLPGITDMRFMDEVLSRGPSDPHVDIVVMYRKRCGHCKPEIRRVHQYVQGRSDVSAYVVEVDRDQNVSWLKSQLLDEEEGTPSTGYWARGKLQLSSPSRRESVDHWVKIARSGQAAPAE